MLSSQTSIQKWQWEGGRQGDWPHREADRSTESHQSPVTCNLGKARNLVPKLRFSGLKMKTTLSLQVVEDLVVNARHLQCQTVCGGRHDYSASSTWFQHEARSRARAAAGLRQSQGRDWGSLPASTSDPFLSFNFRFWNENLYLCLPTVVFCKGVIYFTGSRVQREKFCSSTDHAPDLDDLEDKIWNFWYNDIYMRFWI